MAGLVRTESGNLDVVSQQVVGSGDFVGSAREEFELVVKAWPPSQDASDVQVLADAMPNHGFGRHSLRGTAVVQATCGVNMMVARPPSKAGGIHPATNLIANVP